MRISDWSSDVCSSDLLGAALVDHADDVGDPDVLPADAERNQQVEAGQRRRAGAGGHQLHLADLLADQPEAVVDRRADDRSEEHTSELQSLMRSSYAVFCVKKKQT